MRWKTRMTDMNAVIGFPFYLGVHLVCHSHSPKREREMTKPVTLRVTAAAEHLSSFPFRNPTCPQDITVTAELRVSQSVAFLILF